METAGQPFDRNEYAGRLRRVRQQMEIRGFDLLAVTDPSNIYYVTVYDAWSFYVGQAVLIPSDEGEQPI